MNSIQLFKPSRMSLAASCGLLFVRGVLGMALLHYGGDEKISNPTGWMGTDANVSGSLQAVAGISATVGGLALIVGVLTPLASLAIACTLVGAVPPLSIVLHDPFGAISDGRPFELISIYLAVVILLLLAGPGKISLDRFLFGEKPG